VSTDLVRVSPEEDAGSIARSVWDFDSLVKEERMDILVGWVRGAQPGEQSASFIGRPDVLEALKDYVPSR
jgi:hypothetical protein